MQTNGTGEGGAHEDTAIWEGEEVTIGGKKWIMPAMNFIGMERFRATLNKWGELTEEEQAEQSLAIILHCFQRNYPKVTLEQLKEMVDLGNVKELTQIAMGRSGFKPTGGFEGKDKAGSPPAPI
jgi:hypothetical protein